MQPDNISLPELEEDAKIYLTKYTTVKTIIHSLIPMEYLPTSKEMVAVIYHVKGWQNKEAAFADVNS